MVVMETLSMWKQCVFMELCYYCFAPAYLIHIILLRHGTGFFFSSFPVTWSWGDHRLVWPSVKVESGYFYMLFITYSVTSGGSSSFGLFVATCLLPARENVRQQNVWDTNVACVFQHVVEGNRTLLFLCKRVEEELRLLLSSSRRCQRSLLASG